MVMVNWKVEGEGENIIEVLESFNGDLYFIAEKEENGDIFCYARLYAMPEFAEWGYSNLLELNKSYGKNKIWSVKKANWGNINTYEQGLFVKVIFMSEWKIHGKVKYIYKVIFDAGIPYEEKYKNETELKAMAHKARTEREKIETKKDQMTKGKYWVS